MYFICEKALKIHKYTKFTPNVKSFDLFFTIYKRFYIHT